MNRRAAVLLLALLASPALAEPRMSDSLSTPPPQPPLPAEGGPRRPVVPQDGAIIPMEPVEPAPPLKLQLDGAFVPPPLTGTPPPQTQVPPPRTDLR